jgi:hypothetical protein
MDLNSMFLNMGVLIAAILAVSEFLEKIGWKLEGTASQVRSLGVGAVLGTLGAWLKLGMFALVSVTGDQPFYVSGPLIGIGAAVMSNWSFATPFVKYILEMLKLRPKESGTPTV